MSSLSHIPLTAWRLRHRGRLGGVSGFQNCGLVIDVPAPSLLSGGAARALPRMRDSAPTGACIPSVLVDLFCHQHVKQSLRQRDRQTDLVDRAAAADAWDRVGSSNCLDDQWQLCHQKCGFLGGHRLALWQQPRKALWAQQPGQNERVPAFIPTEHEHVPVGLQSFEARSNARFLELEQKAVLPRQELMCQSAKFPPWED